jgi:hypothetical protein
VILPSCGYLTPGQAVALLRYLDDGGTVVVTGEPGANLPAAERDRLTGHPGVVRASMRDVDGMLPHGRQVRIDGDIAANIHRLPDGSAAVHLVNYGYEPEPDRVPTRSAVGLSVRLPVPARCATVLTADGKRAELEVDVRGDDHLVTLPELGLYTIVVLHDGTRETEVR